MRIGIDVDGVLTDLWSYQLQAGERFFRRRAAVPDTLAVQEMFRCSKALDLLFWVVHFPDYCRRCPPREDAAAELAGLAAAGHRLYLITSRKFAAGKTLPGACSRAWLRTWLAENGFSVAGIHFCTEAAAPEEKERMCRRLGIDLMIDDNPDICEYLAHRGFRVLLFDAPYNRAVRHPRITRVRNWRCAGAEIARLAAPAAPCRKTGDRPTE